MVGNASDPRRVSVKRVCLDLHFFNRGARLRDQFSVILQNRGLFSETLNRARKTVSWNRQLPDFGT